MSLASVDQGITLLDEWMASANASTPVDVNALVAACLIAGTHRYDTNPLPTEDVLYTLGYRTDRGTILSYFQQIMARHDFMFNHVLASEYLDCHEHRGLNGQQMYIRFKVIRMSPTAQKRLGLEQQANFVMSGASLATEVDEVKGLLAS